MAMSSYVMDYNYIAFFDFWKFWGYQYQTGIGVSGFRTIAPGSGLLTGRIIPSTFGKQLFSQVMQSGSIAMNAVGAYGLGKSWGERALRE